MQRCHTDIVGQVDIGTRRNQQVNDFHSIIHRRQMQRRQSRPFGLAVNIGARRNQQVGNFGFSMPRRQM